jgi:orotidine-5'-phosphate decarboxylase
MIVNMGMIEGKDVVDTQNIVDTILPLRTDMMIQTDQYLAKNNPGDILISDKTAEILKLKQYVLTDSIIEDLKRAKIPETILTQLKEIQDLRYRSPKDRPLAGHNPEQ